MEICKEARLPSEMIENRTLCTDIYSTLKEHMESKTTREWLERNRSLGEINWGLGPGSSHVRLKTETPSIFGVIIIGEVQYYGVIRRMLMDIPRDLSFFPGKIGIYRRSNPLNTLVSDCHGWSVDANGQIQAGKIDKQVYKRPDGSVSEWHGMYLKPN